MINTIIDSKEIKNTKDKNKENNIQEILENLLLAQTNNIKKVELTGDDLSTAITINKLENPFEMINVKYVMKDLNLSKSSAYKIFQRKDFPAINLGKNKQVMLVAYVIWKMKRKEW